MTGASLYSELDGHGFAAGSAEDYDSSQGGTLCIGRKKIVTLLSMEHTAHDATLIVTKTFDSRSFAR